MGMMPMLWHKHMSDMIDDPKVRRLVKKFGSDGYAVYNLILERVTKRLTTESPAPDLEESATDIADLLNMDTVRVEEIVWFCIQNDLFGQDEVSGRVLVHKVYKFIQQSETRSKRIREMVAAYRSDNSEDVGYVYILKGESLYKIGKAGNVEIRCRELSNERGERLEIFATKSFPHAMLIEHELHDAFKHKRIEGEWFDLSEDDLADIAKRWGIGASRPSETGMRELEQNRTRTEQKRIREEKPKKATHPTLSVPIGQTRYDNLCREWGARVVDGYISRAVAYAEAHGKPYVDYAAAAWTYMQRDIKEGKLVARPKDEGPRTFAEAREMEGELS